MQILTSVIVALTIVMTLPSAQTQLAASLAHVTKASLGMASAVIVSIPVITNVRVYKLFIYGEASYNNYYRQTPVLKKAQS